MKPYFSIIGARSVEKSETGKKKHKYLQWMQHPGRLFLRDILIDY